MDLEDLKSEWRKSALMTDENHDGMVIVREKTWFAENRTAIDGVLCIMVGMLLLIVMMLKWTFLSGNGIATCLLLFLIAVYALVKGVFTMLFFRDKRRLDEEVNKFILCNLKNRLYFVYERMLWLWGVLPAVLLYSAFALKRCFDINSELFVVCCFSAGVLYIVVQFIVGQILLRRKRHLLSDIEKMSE